MRTNVAGQRSAYVLALALSLIGFLPARSQTTVWVDDCKVCSNAPTTACLSDTNCPGGVCVPGTGTGTLGDPYCKIQTAICNIKTTGGTINVLPGTYREAIRVTANISIFAPDGPAVTTLDATGKPCPTADFCTIGAEPNCSAVYFPSAAGTTSRIEGIHITNTGGGKDQPGLAAKIGAGILVYGSSPTITRNEIVGNTISHPTYKLYYGGGIYINGVSAATPPRPVITNNLIQGNTANPPAGQNANALSEGDGGGIYVGYNAAPIITANTFKTNFAGNPLTANQFGTGGGIAMYSRVTVEDTKISGNLFTDNDSSDFGAGIAFREYAPSTTTEPSRATVDNNIFNLNGGIDGGAMGTDTTRAKIYNNTIHNNNGFHGGAIYFGTTANAGDVAEFVNNLVTSNVATGSGTAGGLYVATGANPTVRFNDLWGNTPANVGGTKIDADYIGVNGGVSVDPLYVNRTAVPPDFHLLTSSPVIEVGDNTVATALTDYDGAPRFQDKDYNGIATVDMGAFEFQPDFDGDGIVDWQDPDQDNDGVANASDCAPLNRAISQAPDRVASTLRLDKAGASATLKWLHAYQAPTYNVYRGTFGGGVPFAYNETCFDTENTARTVNDGATPTPGNGFYYIISSRNTCGESAAVTNGQGLHHTPSPTCTTANRNSDADTPKDIGDNCPLATNATQGDVDADSQGDACDNCPSLANVDQADTDADGIGDTCQCGSINCDDGNVCTDDSCVTGTGCVYTNNTAACNDGDACTVGDTCQSGVCTGSSPVACTASDQCHVAGTCNPATGTCSNPEAANGSVCDDGNECTTGDVCGGGACAGTPITAPPEAQNLRVQSDKAAFIWDPMPNSPHYDVVRGDLGSLPVGPGLGDEVCFDDLVAAVLVDTTVPAPATGFWYLSRGENTCGGNGTYGTQSNLTPRTTTTCP